MAVAHTTVLEMLGKDVSFSYQRKFELSDTSSPTFTKHISGTVTDIVFHLSNDYEISVDHGDFYFLSDLLDFSVSL